MVENDDHQKKYTNEIGSRLDFLQKIPLSNTLIVAISLAGFFTYYDLTNYSYISPVFKDIWDIGDKEIAFGASMTILGYVVGSFCISIVSDQFGRKTSLVVSIVILTIGSFATAWSQNMTQMAIFRLITGIGIGAEIAVVAVYIAEISPKSRRGRYISMIMILGWIGITSSGPISFLLIEQNQVFGAESWRLVAALGGLVAIIILPYRTKLPESPRWLIARGKIIKANEVLESFHLAPLDTPEVSAHLLRDSVAKSLWGKESLLRIILFIGIWSFILLPIYASLLLVVEFVNQGLSLSESISINTLSSFGFVAGGCFAIIIAERIERKYQVAFASSIMGLAFVLRGLLIYDYLGLATAGFLAFASNAWLITSLISYTTENFPTEIRSTGTGIIEGSGRGLASFGPIVFVFLQPLGFLYTMITMASFAFVATILVLLYGSRTLGKSLEELNKE
jgi:MFS transporter, putative metabolite:H+ symporter